MKSHHNKLQTTIIALLLGLLLSGLGPGAWAQQDAASCEFNTLRDAFQAYVQTVDASQIGAIQERLNALGYGPIDDDGVLGRDTRLALQQFCQARQVQVGADRLAVTLVTLLQQTPAAPPRPAAAEPDASANVYYRWGAAEEEPPAESPQGQADDGAATADVAAIPDVVNELLADMEGIVYPNAMLFRDALAQRFADSGVDYRPYLEQILDQARVVVKGPLQSLQWQGADCGCSRDFTSLVYGYYPYWQADGEVQALDFSLLDRIVFYALSLTPEGEIRNPLQWSDTWNAAAFIATAHRYRVDVDLAIHASGWQRWDRKTLQRAARAIVATATETFSRERGGLLNDPLGWLEGGASQQGDGLTLIFADYTASLGNRSNIITLVTTVFKLLQQEARDYRLNIQLDADITALDGQTAFSDLAAILLGDEDSPAPVDQVLLFLQQPTTDTKKTLRRVIEDEFHGAQRKAVLRKIVPVISPYGHGDDPRGAFTQFSDDLIYFQDNFAGVGLWPLPLESDADMTNIRSKIIELYSRASSDDHIGGLVDQYLPGLCQFACPNRWLFRLAFDVLLGALLLYGLAAFWFCRLRSIYKARFPYFAAAGLATLLIFLISLVCDPYWQARADAVIATLGLLIAIVITVRYVSRATRPPLP